MFLPAIVQIGMASAFGQPQLISYAQYLPAVMFFLALFAAAQAPEVIVTDRQYGVLSLYLSRSLSVYDYIAAKLLAFTGALFVLMFGPQLVLFTGKILISAEPWTTLTNTYKDLWPIAGGTFIAACYMAFIGLALAAFSARRAFASAAVMAFFVLMPALRGIANVIIQNPDDRRYAVFTSPFLVITGFANWLWDIQASARVVRRQFGAPGAARALANAGLPNVVLLVCGARDVCGGARVAGAQVSEDRSMTAMEDGRWKMEDGGAHVELRDASRWYGNVVAVNAITVSLETGDHGAAWAERRGKVHRASHDRGAARAFGGSSSHRRAACGGESGHL